MPMPADADARRSARRRGLGKLAALIVIAVPMALALAASCRPGWYRPAAADPARLPADKAALAALQDEISAALNAGRPVRVRLQEDQINRWLAGRAEFEPLATLDLGRLHDPQVALLEDRVRIAARVERGALRAVLSISGRAEVGNGEVVVAYDWPRLGMLPVPAGWLGERVRLDAWDDGRQRVTARGPGALAIRNSFVWPNGRRRCRVTEIALRPGLAEIALEPLPVGP